MTEPQNTPPAPTTAPSFTPEQQAYVDQMVEGRLARDRQSRPPAPSNLAELQQRAAAYDQLMATTQTDQERAVATARDTALREGRQGILPQLVAAEIRATSGGVITAEQAAAIVGPLNPAYFLDDKGAVDAAKVGQYVSGLPIGAPATAPAGTPPAVPPAVTPPAAPVWPALGQGHHESPAPSGADAGRARARGRFGNTLGPGRTPPPA